MEDIDALPEGVRAELVEGKIYFMATPATVHQAILTELVLAAASFVRDRRGDCEVFPAPFAVHPYADDSTHLEPDLTVICDKNKIKTRGCMGAPDWVVEILSPSTRKRDLFLKLHIYAEAGVREYWIVDPDRKEVLVYLPETGSFPSRYTFRDRIPVEIWEGKLKIDFRQINDRIAYLESQRKGKDDAKKS